MEPLGPVAFRAEAVTIRTQFKAICCASHQMALAARVFQYAKEQKEDGKKPKCRQAGPHNLRTWNIVDPGT